MLVVRIPIKVVIKILNRMRMVQQDAECLVQEYNVNLMTKSVNFHHFLKFAKSALESEVHEVRENQKRPRDTFFVHNDKKPK